MADLTCECGKEFEHGGGLATHRKYCSKSSEEVEDKFKCKCGKTFKSQGQYNTHRNYCEHSDREPPEISYDKVECPDCGDMVAETQLENHRGSKTCRSGGTFETLRDGSLKNEELEKQILKLRKNGKTYNEIENELECSKVVISQVCKENGLDNSNFLTGEKKEKIREFRKDHTVSETAEKLSVSESSVQKYSQSDRTLKTETKDKVSRKDFLKTSKYKGRLAEEKIAAKFTELGHTVLDPRGNKRYDFVVEAFGDFHKIQCKYANYKVNYLIFNCSWGCTLSNKNKTYSYSKNDIDYFSVFCSELDQIFLVPIEDAANTSCRLRIKEPDSNQRKNIKWAEDYRIENSFFG